jgi:hypothetical protein
MSEIIDREPINCSAPACQHSGCEVILLANGDVIIANVGVYMDEIAGDAQLAKTLADHPDKSLGKSNFSELYAAMRAIAERRP